MKMLFRLIDGKIRIWIFLKDLHAQVLEQMLQGELDAHLGYEKHSTDGYHSGNSRNGSFSKKIQTEYGEKTIEVPRDRNGDFTPVVVPKHESRGLSIERLVISLYAKGLSVSDIEDELCGTSTGSSPSSPTK